MAENFDRKFRDNHRISPTQIETYVLCPRKWGYGKLDGLIAPSSEYADLGSRCHRVLELWQRDGTPIDLTTKVGKIVSAGIKFLPRPGTHYTEHNFVYDTGRVTFHGRMDLRGVGTESVQTVWDHKTTTSFNWLKLPQVLRRDPQTVIYAKAVLDQAYRNGLVWSNKSLQRVELNWIYYLTNPKRPRSRKVQLHIVYDEKAPRPVCPDNVQPEHFGVMTLDELEARFFEFEDLSLILLSHHQDKLSGKDLPHNVTACSAYGGCPYLNNPCNLSIGERIKAMEAQQQAKSLTLAEKIRAGMSAAAAAVGAAPAAPVVAPTAPVVAPAAPVVAPAAPTIVPAAPTIVPGAAPIPPAVTVSPPPSFKAKLAAQMGQQTQVTDPPAVNPPEKSKGTDPDASACAPSVSMGPAGGPTVVGRIEIAKAAMQSLVEARVYSIDDNRYAMKIAADSVKLADALIAALAK